MKMLNKRERQIEDRRIHRESLKAKRRGEPVLERKAPSKVEIPFILIVCEGKNTEPSYFKQFKLSTAVIKTVGAGLNTMALVKKAKELSDINGGKKSHGDFDQVWCVFDADPKPDNPKQSSNFNEAINLAEGYGFGVAYSNQAFEYWIILHLDDHQGGGMNRDDYTEKINKLLKPYGLEYDGDKSKIISEEIFEILDGVDEKTNTERKLLAIQRARKIYNLHDHTSPAKEESTTTVFKLIEELINYI